MLARKIFAEILGTALLVFIGAGMATLSFGFLDTGMAMQPTQWPASAGIVATALAFGLVMLILAYALGPISGAHINPAVTMGFFAAGRMTFKDAVIYWCSQIIGGIVGAGVLYGLLTASSFYAIDVQGLGANGWGEASMIDINWVGAFFFEVVLTFLFVAVVLAVTGRIAKTAASGAAIGLALATVHLIGIAVTGTSVNPARSLGPAIYTGGDALSQVWLFIIAPLIGAVLAAAVMMFLYPQDTDSYDVESGEAEAAL